MLKENISTLVQLDNPNQACEDRCYFVPDVITDDIDINSNFECTGKTIFLTRGNINIEPNDFVENQNTGCIYIAKDNINIKEGSFKSDISQEYDYLEGFFIAENTINIEEGDIDEEIKDGLEINGSLIAFGRDTQSNAIQIDRDLDVNNSTYPVLLVNYDFKYLKISELLLGKDFNVYKQDMGFNNI